MRAHAENIQGTVQGLTKGGFIKHTTPQDFDLPQNGQFIVSYNNTDTRYKNALNYYNTFIVYLVGYVL